MKQWTPAERLARETGGGANRDIFACEVAGMELPFMHETRAFVLGNWLQYNEPEAYEEYVEQIISHRLASPEEAIAARHGEWHDIPPTDKIRAYDQLVTMVDTFLREHPGGVIGLAPITANPPHYGHANLLRVVRQACAQL